MQPDPRLDQMAALAAAGASARAALRVHVAADIYAALAIMQHDDDEVVSPEPALDRLAAYALGAADRFLIAVESRRS